MNYLVFDFETCYEYNLPWMKGSYPVSLCLSYKGELRTWIFNHSEISPLQTVNIPEIQEYFDKADIIVAHNLKFDLHWLRAIGINTRKNQYFCTMVAEYILNNQNKNEISLKDCSKKYGLPDKIDLVKEWWDSGYETFDIPLSTLIPYGEQDVLNCEAIFLAQYKKMVAEKRSKIIQLRCASLRVTQEIEWNGMAINTDFATEMSDDYGKQIEDISKSIDLGIREALPELSTIPFKLTSNDHLSAILFGGKIKYKGRVPGKKEGTEKNGDLFVETRGLGFLPAAKTETKKEGYYQTDISQVEALKPKTQIQKDFIAAVQTLSKMEKMKGTYCDGLLEKQIDGVVHPSVNEAVTATGRYSSSNPNAQNIPREGTSPVKKMFITRYKEG